MKYLVCFFFSSRRRHTRSLCDWSSDVCSSDLLYCPFLVAAAPLLLLLTGSCCSSALAFYTAHFSLRQRPRFLKCKSLVAAAPHFLYCPFLVPAAPPDRKSTRLNSSHTVISYAVFCLKKKKKRKKEKKT